MPWEWVPSPSDLTKPVLKVLADGSSPEPSPDHWIFLKEEKKLVHYHHCEHCDGWIEGRAHQHREDSLGPLCGRRGTTYDCARCGREIGFFGMMS